MPVTWFTEYPGPDPEWTVRGACRHHNPDLWFARENTAESRQAEAICRACPVVRDCFRYALAVPGLRGIWGATSSRIRTMFRNGTYPGTPQSRNAA
jgi:WhiB family redox-sensing transcriptional regulator